MQIGLYHFLFVAAGLFAAGLLTILVKRNALGILMGVELVLNAANVNLVAFGRYGAHAGGAGPQGQVFALFVIVIAAAEAAVAMAICLNFYNNFSSIDVERGRELKG
jgi:NADH:ubiquinone oxidoreductase subunit K